MNVRNGRRERKPPLQLQEMHIPPLPQLSFAKPQQYRSHSCFAALPRRLVLYLLPSSLRRRFPLPPPALTPPRSSYATPDHHRLQVHAYAQIIGNLYPSFGGVYSCSALCAENWGGFSASGSFLSQTEASLSDGFVEC